MAHLTLFELHKQYDAVKVRPKYDHETQGYLTEIYPKYMNPARKTARKILEIGVAKGGSLLAMRDFFLNATVYGVDIVPPKKWRLKSYRIDFRLGNQADVEFMKGIAALGPFDFIIDDAGHNPVEQAICIDTIFHSLKPNGYYFIEDILKAKGERIRKHVNASYKNVINYPTMIVVKK